MRSAQSEDVFTHVWLLNDKITVLFPKAIQPNKENGRKTWDSAVLHVSSWPVASERMSDSDLVSICHACICVWMQPYITQHRPRVDYVIFLTGVVR